MNHESYTDTVWRVVVAVVRVTGQQAWAPEVPAVWELRLV